MAYDGRHLNAFLAVVSHGSLCRAADALHLTQPALSRTIKRLEAQVGAALFERLAKGMALTQVGEALLPHAQLMQRESELATEEIDALRGLAKGTIRVGTIGSAASVVLPTAIERTLQRWPNLRVIVVEGVSDRLARALVGHEIDLALDVARPDDEEICVVSDCEWQDRNYVVAAAGHPLQRRSALTLAETMNERWAVPPRGTDPYEHMQQVFAAHGLGLPNVLVETRSITVLKSLIVRAGFLSWMAEPICDAELMAGLIAPLPLPGAVSVRTLAVFRRRKGSLPRPAAMLVQQLREMTPPALPANRAVGPVAPARNASLLDAERFAA